MIKHYWLYVLLLHEDKYYVGITSKKNPMDRINEHMNGFYSAQWVKRYKPIEPVEIIDIGNITPAESDRLELKRTVQYMKKYGYQNVRGGKYNYDGKYIKVGEKLVQEKELYIKICLGIMTLSALFLASLAWK